MENFKIGFVSFIASFISSQSDNPKTRELLVRKMMRMKNVQKIILNSLSQLSSLVYQEILAIEKIYPTTVKIAPKNPKLLTLAEDIKNVMNNYVFIQGKVSDMREIINSFDEHIEIQQENDENSPLCTSAYSFLSAIPQSQIMTNVEIEEISNELWSKQMEMESVLKVEVDKLRQFQNTVENRYHYKYEFLKAKTGLKIKTYEDEKEKIGREFSERANRLQMANEEYFSVEYEKVLNEEKRISKIFDPHSVRDLHEAITKIKELLSIKLIYEKKRNKDEKLIKGLNAKLQFLLDNYSSLSERHSNLEIRFEELKSNHDALAESLSLKIKEKSQIISKQESLKIEQLHPEVIFSEFPIRKTENIIDTRALSTKTRNESIRIYRTESKLDRNRRAPRKKLKTAAPVSHTPILPVIPSHENQEQAIQEFKQALISIDEGFQMTNKALNEDLEELVNYKVDVEIQNESQELLSRIVRGISKQNPRKTLEILIDTPGVLNPITEFTPTAHVMVKQDKAIQTGVVAESCSVQTTSNLYSKIGNLWSKHKDHKRLSGRSKESFEGLAIEILEDAFYLNKENGTQTEKEVAAPIELRMTENQLIKGLLHRPKRTSYNKPEENENQENSIIEKILKIPVFSEPKYEEIKETQINELFDATNQYKKEFLIQSQLRGYKRLELQNKHILWEDIINRRITEGEQDKISIYLRGLLGTDIFESEKTGVIQMIEGSKIQDFSTFTANQLLSVKQLKAQRSKKNWKKLISLLITQNISQFMEKIFLIESPKEKLFEVAKKIKFVKHRLKRVSPDAENRRLGLDEFGFNRSDKWRLRSVTPTLADTRRVKSRYMDVRNVQTTQKLKRPMRKITQYRTMHLSPQGH